MYGALLLTGIIGDAKIAKCDVYLMIGGSDTL
jgi:hypothetical protein